MSLSTLFPQTVTWFEQTAPIHWIMTNQRLIDLLWVATEATLVMVFISGLIGFLIGTPIGILLHLTKPNGLLQQPILNKTLSFVVNIGRSIPFLILMIAIIPFTKLITGTMIGTAAAIVPLTVGAIPFISRLIENTLLDIPSGLIEAAQAMGARPLQIIYKVLLPEALPGIINSITVTLITLTGYSAMAGTVGGGGLGYISINYGYQRFEPIVMIITVVELIIIVQLIQMIGDRLARYFDHR